MKKYGANSQGEFVLKIGEVMDSLLILKSKQFALDIIKVCNSVKREKKESILTN